MKKLNVLIAETNITNFMPNGNINFEEEIAKRDEEIRQLNENVGDLEAYFMDLRDLVPVPLCNISPLGAILDINRAFQEMAEYSIIEIIGKSIETVFLEKKTGKILEKAVKEGIVRDEELSLISKKGKKIPVSVSCSLRRDQEGNLIGYYLTLVDITERKEFNEELRRQVEKRTKELQEKVEEVEKINNATIGREMKMIELKEEVSRLKDIIAKGRWSEENK